MILQQARYSPKKGWTDLPSQQAWDSPRTLIFAFCSPLIAKAPAPLAELKSKFPNSSIVGCSTSGEIQGKELTDEGIVVSFCRFDEAEFQVVSSSIHSPDESHAVGKKLATELASKHGLKGILIFSDGLNANGSTLIAGFNDVIDSKEVLIGGGLAGDGNQFQQTFIVLNGEIKLNSIVAIGLYGEALELHGASRGGWDIFGPERIITKSLGNTLYEIDHRPALELYKDYLGTKASELPASGLLFPLQISPQMIQKKSWCAPFSA